MPTKIENGIRRDMTPEEVAENQSLGASQIARLEQEKEKESERKNNLKLLQPDAPMAQIIKAVNCLLEEAGGKQ